MPPIAGGHGASIGTITEPEISTTERLPGSYCGGCCHRDTLRLSPRAYRFRGPARRASKHAATNKNAVSPLAGRHGVTCYRLRLIGVAVRLRLDRRRGVDRRYPSRCRALRVSWA